MYKPQSNNLSFQDVHIRQGLPFNSHLGFFSEHMPPNTFYQIPTLPVLDKLVECCIANTLLPDLSNTLVVGVQHILETTASLFKSVIELGVLPNNIYLSGKSYSSSPVIEKEIHKLGINLIANISQKKVGEFKETFIQQIQLLWEIVMEDLRFKKINRIIILDDGGRCLELLPNILKLNYPIVGIEQTRGGLYSAEINSLPIPLIEVATSASKKYLESPFIAKAVLVRVANYIQQFASKNNEIVCGVIGNGSIGNTLVAYLLNKGFKVIICDYFANTFNKPQQNLCRVETIEMLFSMSDIIFGCTGNDVTEGIELSSINKSKHLISCSSEDKEFLSLLKQMASHMEKETNPLDDIVYKKNSLTKITIVRGGFPINFDRFPWCVPANEIEITQGLLLSAFIQAFCIFQPLVLDGITINHSKKYCLDPYLQRFVVNQWFSTWPSFSKDDIKRSFEHVEWIKENSGGNYNENLSLKNLFSTNHNITPSNYARL